MSPQYADSFLVFLLIYPPKSANVVYQGLLSLSILRIRGRLYFSLLTSE